MDAAWASEINDALKHANVAHLSIWGEIFEDLLGPEILMGGSLAVPHPGNEDQVILDQAALALSRTDSDAPVSCAGQTAAEKEEEEKLLAAKVTLDAEVTREAFAAALGRFQTQMDNQLKATWQALSQDDKRPYEKQVAARLTVAFAELPPTATQPDEIKRQISSGEIMLNLLYAPRDTKLAGLAKTLTRAENLSHLVAYSTTADEKAFRIDRVEMPRLLMSFTQRKDQAGIER